MKFFKTVLVLSAYSAFLSAIAIAQEGAGDTAASGGISHSLGPALAVGAAALGGALGQGKAAGSALEGMARNPQASLLTPMLLGMAMIESIVLLAWVIAFIKY